MNHDREEVPGVPGCGIPGCDAETHDETCWLPKYELVMPFTTVASKGGPHDDDSYTAGWECGRLDGWLAAISGLNQRGIGDWRPSGTFTVRTANVPQVDLIAMRHGYTAEPSENQTGEWTQIRLAPSETGEVE